MNTEFFEELSRAIEDWTRKERIADGLALRVQAPPALIFPFDSEAFSAAWEEAQLSHQHVRRLALEEESRRRTPSA